MRKIPDALMLFAAGFGTRMGALTQNRPKPMVPVAGRPLIDYAIDIVDAADISTVVINLHYLPNEITRHLAHRKDLQFSPETKILETGGGLRAALPLLGVDPVFTLNSDAVWTGKNPLLQLRAAWDPAIMDALLLLLPAAQAHGHSGRGDFLLKPDGRIERANGAEGYVYLGAQILKTQGLSAISEPVFSLNRLWDIAISQGRAYGIVHQGAWCDVGQPASISIAEGVLHAAI